MTRSNAYKRAGFDAAFNYKTTTDYTAKLKELCPKGIDCYFDNVGGPISECVFPLMNLFGRVFVCGQIALYNQTKPSLDPVATYILVSTPGGRLHHHTLLQSLAGRRQADGAMGQRGKLKCREEIVEGCENIPKAFIALLEGKNTGRCWKARVRPSRVP